MRSTINDCDDFKAMKSRITEYFDGISDDQLKVDLEEAGYSFYKNIKTQIILMPSRYILPRFLSRY